jgi:hypothetical protein
LTYGGRYLNSAWLLPLYCLAQAFHVMESLFSCYMKASKLLLWRSYAPQLMGSVVSLAVGLLLIPKLAEAGFMVALIASFAIGAALAICLANFGIVPGKLVFARRQV